MKYLFVGLGNIGEEYEGTRHNVGFEVVNALAQAHHVAFEFVHQGEMTMIKYRSRCLYLLKPHTYMNLSGSAVRYHLQKLKLDPSSLVVITDDIHLDLGVLRLKRKGGHGGHNGLRDIEAKLQTSAYPRLRIGIGHHFHPGQQAEYVLSQFKPAEHAMIQESVEKAVQMLVILACQGYQATTQLFQ